MRRKKKEHTKNVYQNMCIFYRNKSRLLMFFVLIVVNSEQGRVLEHKPAARVPRPRASRY